MMKRNSSVPSPTAYNRVYLVRATPSPKFLAFGSELQIHKTLCEMKGIFGKND